MKRQKINKERRDKTAHEAKANGYKKKSQESDCMGIKKQKPLTTKGY